MAFPSPSLAPPALQPYQLSYGGLVFGGIVPGSPYQLQTLQIGMPDVASGDLQRALDHGEFAGVDLLPGADITIVQAVTADGVSLDHAVQALSEALTPGGPVERPLWLQMPSGTFCRLCRPRKHDCPIDINRVFAGASIATSLLHSTDPRWYAAPSMQQTVGVPATIGGGLVMPAVGSPGFLFGSGGVGGLLTVVNSGGFESRPVLVVTGPCTNPRISNLSIPGSPVIGVNQALAPGDQLVIDTDWQSVIYTVSGSDIGASRRNALQAGTTWWNLPANSSSQIEFTTADSGPVTGTLTVASASAHLSL